MIQAIKDKFEGLRRRINKHERFASVFSGPEGEEVLRDILRMGHALEPTFAPGDPHATSFREGQRHLALSIAKIARRDTTELIKQIEQGLEHED